MSKNDIFYMKKQILFKWLLVSKYLSMISDWKNVFCYSKHLFLHYYLWKILIYFVIWLVNRSNELLEHIVDNKFFKNGIRVGSGKFQSKHTGYLIQLKIYYLVNLMFPHIFT
jgi:hypothetical protein